MGIQDELTPDLGYKGMKDHHLEDLPEHIVEQLCKLRCRDCWHWEYDETVEDEESEYWSEQTGTCHRYPSDTATLPKQNTMTGEVSLEVLALHRPARWDHWCGEFKRAKEWPGFVPPPGGYNVDMVDAPEE